MKREIIITAILLLTVGTLIISRTQKGQFSELVHSNVEALSFNEWGGGTDLGGGVVIWYEYIRTTYEHKYCYSPDAPYLICDCVVNTCQGFGDIFCNGSIVCY